MVQFYGVFLVLVKCLILYNDDYYYRLVVFNMRIIEIGAVFCERILADHLKVGVDYDGRSWSLGYGLIKTDIVTTKVRKPETGGVELNSYYSESVNDTNEFMEPRLSYNVYNVNNDKEDNVFNYGAKELMELRRGETQLKAIDVSSYIENSAKEISVSQKKENKLDELRNVLDSTSSTECAMKDNEVTHSLVRSLTYFNTYVLNCSLLTSSLSQDVLFQSYMEEKSIEDTMSFEDWKVSRRKFKDGTRKSFIQIFESWQDKAGDVGSARYRLSTLFLFTNFSFIHSSLTN